MKRTQIQLTDEQLRTLKRLAADKKKSLADLVRQSVEIYIAQESYTGKTLRNQRALDAIGKFSSGTTDVSTNHDQYLADIYGQ